jgi:hypothetical protein
MFGLPTGPPIPPRGRRFKSCQPDAKIASKMQVSRPGSRKRIRPPDVHGGRGCAVGAHPPRRSPIGSAEMLDSGWVEAVAAVGALVVAVLAAGFAIREHRNARESFVQDMRAQWADLGPQWARLLMAESGSDFYYVNASADERAQAATLYVNLRDSNFATSHAATRELRRDVRPVTRFIAYAADGVLSGRWRVGEAYDVLGPDVARHHKTIRLLANRDESAPPWLVQAAESNTFDEQDCVLLFAFLLRIEQCRRGDTYGHFVAELASEMRGEHKRSLAACVFRVKRVRRRLFLPLGVAYRLWRGRHPSVRSAYAVPDAPIIRGSQRPLFRRTLEPMWVLRLRLWWAQRRFGPDLLTRRESLRALIAEGWLVFPRGHGDLPAASRTDGGHLQTSRVDPTGTPTRHQRRDRLHRLAALEADPVAVDVGGDAHARVPGHLRDERDVGARLDSEGYPGVAGAVERHLGQTCRLADLGEEPGGVGRLERLAVLVGEDVPVTDPQVAPVCPVGVLPDLPRDERGDGYQRPSRA